MDWIIGNIVDNREWIFSGIGVLILSVAARLIFKNKEKKNINQNIKSGDNSTNVQGGDNTTVTIGAEPNEKE